MHTFGLLHIADASSRVATVNLRVLALAAVALIVTGTVFWAPELSKLRRLSRARIRRRVLTYAVGAAFFLAVMPTVLPWDHLFFDHTDHESAVEQSVHASHCHESPGTCSDAPVSSGPGQLLMGAPLLVTPTLFAVLILFVVPGLAGITLRPEIRPPLALARRVAI